MATPGLLHLPILAAAALCHDGGFDCTRGRSPRATGIPVRRVFADAVIGINRQHDGNHPAATGAATPSTAIDVVWSRGHGDLLADTGAGAGGNADIDVAIGAQSAAGVHPFCADGIGTARGRPGGAAGRAPRSCRHLVALLDTAHRNPTLARHLIQLDMGQVPLLYWPISHREPPVPGVVYPLSWPALRLAPTLMRGGPFNHVARLSVQAIAWDTLQTLVESMPQLQNLCAREIWQAAGSGMAPFDQIGVRAPTGVQAPDGADGDDATTDAASELTRALAPWRRLRVLRLEWQQRDIAGFASADFLDRFLIPLAGNMTAVQLCSRETVTDTAFVHLMTASPHLRTLVLDTWTSHLSIDAVRELLARGAFAPFTSLHLRFADWILGFTQKDLVAILLQARACLQLDLSGFEAPDDQHACADHLLYAVARHAPQYTALLLPHDMPGVTRTAVRFLLKRLRHLTAIQMPCLLGARELELIVDRNPDLTHLSLRGCEGLDTDTVLALLARLPRLIALDIRDTAIAIPVDALRKRHMMPALQRIEGGAAFRGWAVLASRLAGVCVHAHATVWRDFEMRAMCTCDFGREENDYLEPALADAALAADADTEDATTAPPSPFFVGVDAADQVSPLPVPSAPDIQLVLDAGHSR
ncbi:hypothetical protein CXG81DRAFT_18085 [Caulochytrium protostelioides]|uniref:RNI-like protein n=1 Tax=Caulochytrium protostelioides TaxID=1555241 RepID=A0A4P9XAY2_9FUNG|nr:hypothetical protein CXG81DRAFT_18085 [Caulochytrium protostelioides]|eukprot:RKP02261.1 hypothetical protein CXG81DRAFT_18085 [Caulochytrium protostelioides]